MPEYLSPGVYVEEIDAGPKPIEGVSTSTAGAVGVTAMGPTKGKPVLVTSFADFVRKFGGFLGEPPPDIKRNWDGAQNLEGGCWWQFPLSVKGFFDNGGQRLYVKRVFAGGTTNPATASSADLGKGFVSEVDEDATAGAAEVKLRHLIAIDKNTAGLQFVNGDTQQNVGTPFSITGYDPTTSKISIANTVLTGPLSKKRGDYLRISPLSASPVPNGEKTLVFTAKSVGKWGDGLRVKVRPVASRTLNVLADPNLANNDPVTTALSALATNSAGASPVTTIVLDDVAKLFDGDTVLVFGRRFKLSAKNAGAKSFVVDPSVSVGNLARWTTGTVVQKVRKANIAASASLTLNLSGAARLVPGTVVEFDNGSLKEPRTVVSVRGDTVTFSSALALDYLEGDLARVIEAEVLVRYESTGQPSVDEQFGPLGLHDDGTQNFLVNFVNERSNLVEVAKGAGFDETNLSLFPTATSGAGWQALTGGDDQPGSLRVDDFVGEDKGSGKRTGIAALEDVDEISLCLVPGMWSRTVHSALVTHCETLRYRFSIIDPPDGLDVEGIRTFREPYDTKYAALYHPWLVARDPSAGRDVNVAPSAHLAGLYARVDVERGVHKAPANEVVRNVTRFAQDVNKREQDLLNPRNINALRFFPGRGNRVWGARVLTSDSAWKYVNVRRLFIFVEASIDAGTQWVVFEPNDETLWSRVRQTITIFLEGLWHNGMLFGTKASEAFFVKCDRGTMTQDDIDNGRLICQIGIAPVKPAEFVVFRIQQKTIEADEG